MVIAFTGHRPNKLNGYNKNDNIELINTIEKALIPLINDGYTTFITGMALGVDQWAADVVLKLRKQYFLKLVAAIPCIGQEKFWPHDSQVEYRRILSKCDEIYNVSNKPYEPKCMQRRNEFMVYNADLIVAVWDGTFGGTGNCVKYAMKKCKPILVINPTTLEYSYYKYNKQDYENQ